MLGCWVPFPRKPCNQATFEICYEFMWNYVADVIRLSLGQVGINLVKVNKYYYIN